LYYIYTQDTVHSVVFGTLSAVWSGVCVVLVVLWEGQLHNYNIIIINNSRYYFYLPLRYIMEALLYSLMVSRVLIG